MITLTEILGFFAFWLGACVASFLNVVIWRVPRGESIVSPPSHCPRCNAPIKWYQNVPIVAWLALRGRCAACKAPISPRYILIEILGGALFLGAFLRYLAPIAEDLARCDSAAMALVALLPLLFAWIWISLMVVGSFVDYDLQLLPDFVTVGGMAVGLVYHAVVDAIGISLNGLPAHWYSCSTVFSLLGLAFGFGLLWLVRWLGSKAFRREAMGMGDVFLMGAVGATCGPIAVVFTLIFSSLVGSVFGLGMVMAAKTKLGGFREIPFGPYICAGCLVWMLRGQEICAWYMQLLGMVH